MNVESNTCGRRLSVIAAVAVISAVVETGAVATGFGALVAVGAVVGVCVGTSVGVAVGATVGVAVGGSTVTVAVGSGVAVGASVGMGPTPGKQAANRVTSNNNGTRRVMAACPFCKKLIMLSSFPAMLQESQFPPRKRMTKGASYAALRPFVFSDEYDQRPYPV